MPKAETTINLAALWDRYHAGTTTPGDVRRLLLAYDGATTERDHLKRDAEHISADLAAARADLARVTTERDDARRALEAERAARRGNNVI